VRLAAGALVAAALLAPSVAAAPATAPAVVTIAVKGAPGPSDEATGFVIGDGRVLTVAHVVGDGGAITVAGRPAAVALVDRALDLAVLAVPGVGGAAPRPGGDVARVIVPGGARPARLVRRISARVDGVRRPALELRADVAAGDSGAPVVSSAGRLAGVVFARSRGRPGVAYAIDAAALAPLLG
jgi:Trypsin-like peptidase domain